MRLVDVFSLGTSSFTTTSGEGKSLKSIFEDPSVPKCFWDVRNDADALWTLYQVDLASVLDIQLLENASRPSNKKYLSGLDKAVQLDLRLPRAELVSWILSKREIRSLMPTNVFATRPLEANTVQYCANDVIYLPDLHTVYLNRISNDWLAEAKEESLRRLREVHSPTYEPRSPTKALGPWGPETRRRSTSPDWDDYGPSSCRDVIDNCDYELYYDD